MKKQMRYALLTAVLMMSLVITVCAAGGGSHSYGAGIDADVPAVDVAGEHALIPTANQSSKESYPLTLTPQSYPYNKAPQAFVLEDSVTGVTVEYWVNGAWTEEAPVNAGRYDVRLTRPEDETYQSYTQTLTAGLVIERIKAVATPPTVKTPLVFSGQPLALLTPGSTTGGSMQYSCNGSVWSEEIPIATEPGRYQIAWQVIGDANYIGIPTYALAAVVVDYSEQLCLRDNTCPMADFRDIKALDWYHEGVHFCLEEGLMAGVGGDRFAPDGVTTRAMVVTVLWRMEGSPKVSKVMPFADIPAGQWYTEAVRWAYSSGVVAGMSPTIFAPDDPVSREQFATILRRYADYLGQDVSLAQGGGLQRFADWQQVSSWAAAGMQWAVEQGLIAGLPDGSVTVLDPQGRATRAQTANILCRFLRN